MLKLGSQVDELLVKQSELSTSLDQCSESMEGKFQAFQSLLTQMQQEYSQKTGAMKQSLSSLNKQFSDLHSDDTSFVNHVTMKAQESINSSEKSVASIAHSFAQIDQESYAHSQSIIDQCVNATNIQKQVGLEVKAYEDQLSSTIESNHALINENASKITDFMQTSVDGKSLCVAQFTEQLNALVDANQKSTSFLIKNVDDSHDGYLNEYAQVKSNCHAFSVSQKFVLKESIQRLNEAIESEYLHYQASGATPQKREYLYPNSFTPTSPYDRILGRFRNRTNLLAAPITADPPAFDEESENKENNLEVNLDLNMNKTFVLRGSNGNVLAKDNNVNRK